MYVLTIDQRGSSTDVDRVPGLLAALARLVPGATFERSVGDELQGVLQSPAEVVDTALHVLRDGHWYVGIGVGAVDQPLPASPREGSGPAFVAARLAVERAKAAGHVPLAVEAGTAGTPRRGAASRPAGSGDGAAGTPAAPPGEREAANAEAVLRLIGRLVQDRTAAQWKVVDALRDVRDGRSGTHGSQKAAAAALGITEQSVSRALLRSGWQEEWAARPAAEMLLALADGQTAGADGHAARTPSEGDR
ncbi:MarR family transcriptional regulator [Arthrobacter sp. YD4]|uniref:MarR family transcriptional regulator n=1 Tax=Arthrobacter sp. YD4 TaxID=3058043 RepID=UPI0025B3B239|nr:MarR family transcriptional regulator [Arthrobacter sp. YD4]MDN3937325.1 MarR family transcriptional regulator [Arthrobacter sp. YD4]